MENRNDFYIYKETKTVLENLYYGKSLQNLYKNTNFINLLNLLNKECSLLKDLRIKNLQTEKSENLYKSLTFFCKNLKHIENNFCESSENIYDIFKYFDNLKTGKFL